MTDAKNEDAGGASASNAGLCAEREEFEQWFLKTQSNVRVKIQRDEKGIYRNLMVQIAWRAWKTAVTRTKAHNDLANLPATRTGRN